MTLLTNADLDLYDAVARARRQEGLTSTQLGQRFGLRVGRVNEILELYHLGQDRGPLDARVIDARMAGLSIEGISNELGISRWLVSGILKQHHVTYKPPQKGKVLIRRGCCKRCGIRMDVIEAQRAISRDDRGVFHVEPEQATKTLCAQCVMEMRHEQAA